MCSNGALVDQILSFNSAIWSLSGLLEYLQRAKPNRNRSSLQLRVRIVRCDLSLAKSHVSCSTCHFYSVIHVLVFRIFCYWGSLYFLLRIGYEGARTCDIRLGAYIFYSIVYGLASHRSGHGIKCWITPIPSS